jgi:hypothetical protein
VGDQAADDAVRPLHRIEVAVPVPAADRHAGDEVVEDEVVKDDEPGRSSQRVEDPAVHLGVVADVVDGEVGPTRRPLRAALHHVHLDVRSERRHEQRRVVTDP